MKYAKAHVVVFEFTCPKCGENIPAKDGSHMWPVADIPERIECRDCGIPLQVPYKALKCSKE